MGRFDELVEAGRGGKAAIAGLTEMGSGDAAWWSNKREEEDEEDNRKAQAAAKRLLKAPASNDPAYIDWKLYARTDKYYVKRYRAETNLRCMMLVDTSASMHYASEGKGALTCAGNQRRAGIDSAVVDPARRQLSGRQLIRQEGAEPSIPAPHVEHPECRRSRLDADLPDSR